MQGTQGEVTFEVEGPAEILGVINGDMASDELTVGNKRKLYRGTATVILRSKREPGKVKLTATTPGLKQAKVEFKTN